MNIDASHVINLFITREIPAFGGISLALRGKGALGVHLAPPSAAVKYGGAPAAPIVLKTSAGS